ncbi:hypothetical protein DFJ73DRAFT_967711 [Zopfochytrium polystomum]|nr:hypothetical protein DFJ73DRAFT_967711 [Zopfochytrium polystomum]
MIPPSRLLVLLLAFAVAFTSLLADAQWVPGHPRPNKERTAPQVATHRTGGSRSPSPGKPSHRSPSPGTGAVNNRGSSGSRRGSDAGGSSHRGSVANNRDGSGSRRGSDAGAVDKTGNNAKIGKLFGVSPEEAHKLKTDKEYSNEKAVDQAVRDHQEQKARAVKNQLNEAGLKW